MSFSSSEQEYSPVEPFIPASFIEISPLSFWHETYFASLDIIGEKLTVYIKNIGEIDAHDVAYSVSITGGMLGLIDKTADGIISTLSVDNEQAIELDVVFGLGMVDIIAKLVLYYLHERLWTNVAWGKYWKSRVWRRRYRKMHKKQSDEI